MSKGKNKRPWTHQPENSEPNPLLCSAAPPRTTRAERRRQQPKIVPASREKRPPTTATPRALRLAPLRRRSPPAAASPPPPFRLRGFSLKPPSCTLHSRKENCMECLTTSFARNVGKEYNFTCPSKSVSENQWIPGRFRCYFPASTNSSQHPKFSTMAYPMSPLVGRRPRWRSFASSLNLEDEPAPSDSTPSSSEQASVADGTVRNDASENLLSRKLNSDELKSLLADSERSKLLRKLSEANQYNRFLKRQLQLKDDVAVKFKSELAVLELELQALVGLAEEIASFDVPSGSRKINGKYIQSHLLSRLEAVHDKVMEQIKDVDSLKPREISVYWVGMAENVQIMGSFDGWSQGEAMSVEYSGDYARFSVTLKLRPGRYEIKFLVDGDWRLSPEYPIAGKGMTQNNILVVQ